ncbi:unnamed protein product [Gadus morhua 'NCC']
MTRRLFGGCSVVAVLHSRRTVLVKEEPTERRVITAYNPDQKYKVNLKNLKACKAAPLEACAKLLGLAPRDEDNKKLYQNLGILSDRIILKIEALFEIDCDDCKETYRNKLGDTPPLHCRLCLQGSHSCEAIQKKLEAYKPIVDAGDTPTGIVWLCHECLKKNHLDVLRPTNNKGSQMKWREKEKEKKKRKQGKKKKRKKNG